MKQKIAAFAIILIHLAGCSIEQQPIEYGSDECHYCEMTIMDSRYGTEMVTRKGKVFKFDSVECLVRFLKENGNMQNDAKHLLLTPFNKPSTLEDAHQCRILHSRNMPSPMGMFLTAFSDENTAGKYRDESGGTLYSWNDLMVKFESLNQSLNE